MLVFSIIFSFIFTLLIVLVLKCSTNEYGEPFHIKVIYIFLAFFIFLIPGINIMFAIVLIFIFSLGLVFEEIKLKPKNKIMNKIINFLNKEI